MSEQNTTVSIALDELTLEQLVQVSQGLGHQIDKLREQRAYLKAKIDERLAAGERTSIELAPRPAEGDAVAPGAVIDAKAGG
jgi:DNA-binding GntR family transcriptional regulator